MSNIKLEHDLSKNDEIVLSCNNCHRSTHHITLSSVKSTEDFQGITYWQDNRIVMCQGCKGVSFYQNSTNDDDVDWDLETGEGELIDNISLYPSRIEGRSELSHAYRLPPEINRIYHQSYTAIENKLDILAAIGIRAILENVCKEKKAVGKNLEDKIDNLVSQGVLTKEGAEILHSTRIVGNKAAHEVITVPEKDINTLMSIVEHLLTGAYILPKLSDKLPKRPKKS